MTRLGIALPSLLLAGACTAPPPADDPGRDFDEAATFLLPGMESYRFERGTGGEHRCFVECGRAFRFVGIKRAGDCLGVMVFEHANSLPADEWAEGTVVARIRGLDVREVVTDVDRIESGVRWYVADVDDRFRVIATRLALLEQVLARTGERRALVAALRPPASPSWRAPLTIVRRYARTAPEDFTNPWSPDCLAARDPAVAAAGPAIDAFVAEGSPAAGTFELVVATTKPDAATTFLRAFFPPAMVDTVESSPPPTGVHRWRLAGLHDGHDLVAAYLFGHNVML